MTSEKRRRLFRDMDESAEVAIERLQKKIGIDPFNRVRESMSKPVEMKHTTVSFQVSEESPFPLNSSHHA